MTARLLTLPIRHPATALALVVLGTALALAPLVAPDLVSSLVGVETRLRFDFRVEKLFPDDDRRLEDHRAFVDDFGRDDDTAIILLAGDADVLEASALGRIHRITELLRDHPLVDADRVSSLSHVSFVRAEGGWLDVAPLFEPDDAATWDRDAMAALLLDHPIYRDQVVSGDARVCGFVVPLHPIEASPEARRELVAFLRRTLADEAGPGETVHLDGIIVTRDVVLELMRRDSRVYYPTALAVLVLALVLVLRDVRAALLTTTAVVLSVVWTLGLMAWAGIPLNLVSTAIPVLLVVAGVGDAVHLIERLRHLAVLGVAPGEALEQAVAEVGLACLMTSVTTAAGFLSLAFAGVVTLREFGVPTGVGIVFAFVITFLLLPPVLLAWPAIATPRAERRGLGRRIARGAWRLVAARRGWVLLGAAAATLAAVLVAPSVRVESRMLEDFDEDGPLHQTRRFIEERMGGVSAIEVIVRRPSDAVAVAPGGPTGAAAAIAGAGGARARMLDPDVLAAAAALAERLRAEDYRAAGVLSVVGLTDYLAEMNHVLEERAPGTDVLPGTRAAAAQLRFLYESSRPSDPTVDFVGDAQEVLRIRVRVKNLWTPEFFELADRIEAEASALLPPDLEVRVTGFTLMMQAVQQSIIRHLAQSLAIAAGVILLAVVLLTGSVRGTVLGLVANLLPLLLLLAVMALVGFRLRMITSAIFCVVFGIAVDDTIHLFAAIRAGSRSTGGAISRRALRRAVTETGAAMIATSAILAAGFGVLLLSSIRANRLFAGLSILTIVLALAIDLLAIPALLLPRRRRKTSPGQIDGSDRSVTV